MTSYMQKSCQFLFGLLRGGSCKLFDFAWSRATGRFHLLRGEEDRRRGKEAINVMKLFCFSRTCNPLGFLREVCTLHKITDWEQFEVLQWHLSLALHMKLAFDNTGVSSEIPITNPRFAGGCWEVIHILIK